MELAIIDGKKAMDSRDIAALTKKRHADICRDIRGMILTVSNGCNFASVYLDKKNDMTIKELKKIRVAEELADLLIDDEAGFHEVNPICLEGCETVNRFLFDKTIRNLEKKIVGAFNEP